MCREYHPKQYSCYICLYLYLVLMLVHLGSVIVGKLRMGRVVTGAMFHTVPCVKDTGRGMKKANTRKINHIRQKARPLRMK